MAKHSFALRDRRCGRRGRVDPGALDPARAGLAGALANMPRIVRLLMRRKINSAERHCSGSGPRRRKRRGRILGLGIVK